MISLQQKLYVPRAVKNACWALLLTCGKRDVTESLLNQKYMIQTQHPYPVIYALSLWCVCAQKVVKMTLCCPHPHSQWFIKPYFLFVAFTWEQLQSSRKSFMLPRPIDVFVRWLKKPTATRTDADSRTLKSQQTLWMDLNLYIYITGLSPGKEFRIQLSS